MQYYCYHINFSSFLTVQCGVVLISDLLCTPHFKNQIRMDFPSSTCTTEVNCCNKQSWCWAAFPEKFFLSWNRYAVELCPIKAVTALWVQLPSPAWLVQADPSWNLGPCITQQQLLLVCSTSSHCLPWRLSSHGKPCCTRSGMVSLLGCCNREEQALLLPCLWALEREAAGAWWDKGLESKHKNGLGWNPSLSVNWMGFSLLLLSIRKWHSFLQQYMLIGAFKSLASQFYYS